MLPPAREEKDEEYSNLISFLRSIPVPPSRSPSTETQIYKPQVKSKPHQPLHITLSTLSPDRPVSANTPAQMYDVKQKVLLFKIPSELKITKTEAKIVNKTFPHRTTSIKISEIVQVINIRPDKISIKYQKKKESKQKEEIIYLSQALPPNIFSQN